MDRPSEAEALTAAWRALAGKTDSDGWRTIPVAGRENCRLLAGRHFPRNEEAVLVGFKSSRIPSKNHFPEGSGFLVMVADLNADPEVRVWLALLRQEAGNLEMFTMMAADVVSTISSSTSEDSDHLLALFIGRIHSWQSFMLRSKEGVLSHESEVGLFGELEVLRSLLKTGVSPSIAVASWFGPLDGIQDFQFGTGAIEVKTTIASAGFVARITSLEQLDDRLLKPLFLAGVRLQLESDGISLPDQVNEVRSLLKDDNSSLVVLETRLLHAGFFTSMSSRYTRKFSHQKTRFFPVESNFPKLTRTNIPFEIQRANYELDLDHLNVVECPFHSVLESLGVI